LANSGGGGGGGGGIWNVGAALRDVIRRVELSEWEVDDFLRLDPTAVEILEAFKMDDLQGKIYSNIGTNKILHNQGSTITFKTGHIPNLDNNMHKSHLNNLCC
jgi:hypothetical protein